MTASELRLIKRCAEFCRREEIGLVPRGTRGIYVLLKERRKIGKFDVVYFGMARGMGEGIRFRLKTHARSKRKGKLWAHFSVFEVWDNIIDSEVRELEGLFRHIYRRDIRANRLNRQRGFKPLRRIRSSLEDWKLNR